MALFVVGRAEAGHEQGHRAARQRQPLERAVGKHAPRRVRRMTEERVTTAHVPGVLLDDLRARGALLVGIPARWVEGASVGEPGVHRGQDLGWLGHGLEQARIGSIRVASLHVLPASVDERDGGHRAGSRRAISTASMAPSP